MPGPRVPITLPALPVGWQCPLASNDNLLNQRGERPRAVIAAPILKTALHLK